MCLACMYVCVCILHVCLVLVEDRRGHWIFWSQSYRLWAVRHSWWAATEVLEIESRPSAKQPVLLSHLSGPNIFKHKWLQWGLHSFNFKDKNIFMWFHKMTSSFNSNNAITVLSISCWRSTLVNQLCLTLPKANTCDPWPFSMYPWNKCVQVSLCALGQQGILLINFSIENVYSKINSKNVPIWNLTYALLILE